MFELVKIIQGWALMPRQTPEMAALLRQDLGADGSSYGAKLLSRKQKLLKCFN